MEEGHKQIHHEKSQRDVAGVLQSIPAGVEVFIFGSALRKDSGARDLDVLVVYDANLIAAQDIHSRISDLRINLERCWALPVHLTLLNQSEEKEFRFRSRYRCKKVLAGSG